MVRLRVLFDTNVYISFLLSATGTSSAIQELFEHAASQQFDLIIPDAILIEVAEKVENKPALNSRISLVVMESFTAYLETIASIIPHRDVTISPIVRDPDDDYVVAYALQSNVDYLISGDKDLLVLGDTIAPLKIRSPQAFLDEIDGEPGGSLD